MGTFIPTYFRLEEVVPESVFKAHSGAAKLWWLFDDRILTAADMLRMRYGRMECNTWHLGGKHQFRGWRPMACAVGAELSQHMFGRALDLVPLDCCVEEVRADILDGGVFPDGLVSCVEDGVSWLHGDCRNWRDGLLVV